MHHQKASCFRISSFLADGVVAGSGTVLPDSSANSFKATLKEFDVIVPLKTGKLDNPTINKDNALSRTIAGARLHIENLFFMESPSLKMHLLCLEKDPTCFSLWEGQPVDASQKKWSVGASFLRLTLETSDGLKDYKNSSDSASGLWKCVELKGVSIEVAMVTRDGRPLICIPPPGGVVRVVESPNDHVVIPGVAALTAYQCFENVRIFLLVAEELSLLTFEACDLEQKEFEG